MVDARHADACGEVRGGDQRPFLQAEAGCGAVVGSTVRMSMRRARASRRLRRQGTMMQRYLLSPGLPPRVRGTRPLCQGSRRSRRQGRRQGRLRRPPRPCRSCRCHARSASAASSSSVPPPLVDRRAYAWRPCIIDQDHGRRRGQWSALETVANALMPKNRDDLDCYRVIAPQQDVTCFTVAWLHCCALVVRVRSGGELQGRKCEAVWVTGRCCGR